MLIENNKGTHIGSFSILLIMAFCAILLSPYLTSIGTETVIATMLALSIFFINHLRTVSQLTLNLIALYVIFLGEMIAYKIIGVSSADWLYPAGYMGWMFASVLGMFLVKNINYKQLKQLALVIWGASTGYCAYIAIIGKKLMDGDNELGVEMTTAMFSTTFMLFSGCCLIVVLNCDNKMIKILSCIGLVISAFSNFVVLQRGTNAILSVAMYSLILLFNGKRTKVVYGIIISLIIIMVILFQTELYINLLDFVISAIPSERIAARVNSVKLYLETGDYITAGTSFRTRGILLEKTWDTFTSSFSNMLVGVGDHRFTGGPVGNHNEIIDTLARYGILFSAPLFAILHYQRSWFKELIKDYKDNKLYHQVMIVFFVYIFRNCVGNAFSTAVGIELFVFLPMAIVIIQSNNEGAKMRNSDLEVKK